MVDGVLEFAVGYKDTEHSETATELLARMRKMTNTSKCNNCDRDPCLNGTVIKEEDLPNLDVRCKLVGLRSSVKGVITAKKSNEREVEVQLQCNRGPKESFAYNYLINRVAFACA